MPHPYIDLEQPTDCLNSAGNCLHFCFTPTNVVISNGVPLLFGGVNFLADGDGTSGYINVNGVVLTVGIPSGDSIYDSYNIDNSIGKTAADMAAAMVAILNNNFDISRDFSVSVFGNSVLMFGQNCLVSLAIASDLLPTQLSINLPNGGNPIPPQFRPNYSIVGEVLIANNIVGSFNQQPYVSGDSCTPAVFETCYDAQFAAKTSVFTPFISPSTGVAFTMRPQMTNEISVRYSDKYGNPIAFTHSFATSTPIRVYNSRLGPTNYDGLSKYCRTAPCGEQQLITIRPNGQKTCPSDIIAIYYDAFQDDLELFIDAFNYGGAPFGQTSIPYTPASSNILEVNFTPQMLFDKITADSGWGVGGTPVDIYEVSFFRLFVKNTVTGCDTLAADFSVREKEDCGCGEEFIFLSSLGTWESFTTHCLNSVDLDINQTAYKNCLCFKVGDVPTPLPTETVIASSSLTELFSLKMHEISYYDGDNGGGNNYIQEFVNSPQIYWRKGGLFYPVAPENKKIAHFNAQKTIEADFSFRLYKKYSL